MKVTIPAMVEGGKATAGPPLGPALGPLGVNIGQIIALINEKTKNFSGMTIPVKVIVDKDAKSFDVEVGSPPTSAFIKKELGVEKGAKTKDEKAGDLSLEKVVSISKKKASLGNSLADSVNETLGTCLSMGVTVDGKNPRDVIREVNDGKHKELLEKK